MWKVPWLNCVRYYPIGFNHFNMRSVLFLIVVFLMGCSEDRPEQTVRKQEQSMQVETSEMHKAWIKEDMDMIGRYAERRGWEMTQTGTGTLYYKYNENPDGEIGVPGKYATVEYTVSLLDGTLCYTSEEDGPATVKIEKEDVESGIHESLQLMHVGEEMAVILPPHRAHGLLGDQDKVPAQSVVVYQLKMISLK